MKSVFFVQPDEAETARRLERILMTLPEECGILFAGISVIADPLSLPRKVLYQIMIGCDRSRDTSLIDLLVRTYLRQEVKDESQLVIRSYRGVDRHSFGS